MPEPQNVRPLARDTATDRTGEIMHVAHEGDRPVQVWLRPVGGGEEWTADPKHVRRLRQDGSW